MISFMTSFQASPISSHVFFKTPIYGAPSRATVTTTQMQQKEEWAGAGEKYFRDHAVDPSPCCDPQMLPKLPPF